MTDKEKAREIFENYPHPLEGDIDCDICATPVYRKMFIKGANWLKSKIIK